jgi:catalase
MHIRERMVGHLARIDSSLAEKVALGIGVKVPSDVSLAEPLAANQGKKSVALSPSLRTLEREDNVVLLKGRKLAILVEDGFDGNTVSDVQKAMEKEGIICEVVSKNYGMRKAVKGSDAKTDKNHITTASLMYDAVFVPGGAESVEKMKMMGDVLHFIREAYKHGKPIAATGEAVSLLEACQLPEQQLFDTLAVDKGVISSREGAKAAALVTELKNAMLQHRFWEREKNKAKIPA